MSCLRAHASEISFDHPVTKARVSVTVALPEDLRLAIASCRPAYESPALPEPSKVSAARSDGRVRIAAW